MQYTKLLHFKCFVWLQVRLYFEFVDLSLICQHKFGEKNRSQVITVTARLYTWIGKMSFVDLGDSVVRLLYLNTIIEHFHLCHHNSTAFSHISAYDGYHGVLYGEVKSHTDSILASHT